MAFLTKRMFIWMELLVAIKQNKKLRGDLCGLTLVSFVLGFGSVCQVFVCVVIM